MLVDSHVNKAKRLERTLAKLSDGSDYETIIEVCYSAGVQYIATICERRRKSHSDTHKGLAKFLDDKDLTDLAAAFRELEQLRSSQFYGAKGDGKSAKAARRILAEIKEGLH